MARDSSTSPVVEARTIAVIPPQVRGRLDPASASPSTSAMPTPTPGLRRRRVRRPSGGRDRGVEPRSSPRGGWRRTPRSRAARSRDGTRCTSSCGRLPLADTSKFMLACLVPVLRRAPAAACAWSRRTSDSVDVVLTFDEQRFQAATPARADTTHTYNRDQLDKLSSGAGIDILLVDAVAGPRVGCCCRGAASS